MIKHYALNVKLPHLQLNKLKSGEINSTQQL